MLRPLLHALAGLLIALVLAACGGSQDEPAATRPATQTAPASNATAPAARPAKPAPHPTATNPPAGSRQKPSAPGNDAELTPRERQREFERYCDTHPGACD